MRYTIPFALTQTLLLSEEVPIMLLHPSPLMLQYAHVGVMLMLLLMLSNERRTYTRREEKAKGEVKRNMMSVLFLLILHAQNNIFFHVKSENILESDSAALAARELHRIGRNNFSQKHRVKSNIM